MRTEGRWRQEDHFIQVYCLPHPLTPPHATYLGLGKPVLHQLCLATSQVTHILCCSPPLPIALRLEPVPTRILSTSQDLWAPAAQIPCLTSCFQPSYTEIIKYNPHLQEICRNCLCLETKIHKTESSGSSLLQRAIHAQASRPEIAQESLFPAGVLPTRHF